MCADNREEWAAACRQIYALTPHASIDSSAGAVEAEADEVCSKPIRFHLAADSGAIDRSYQICVCAASPT